MPAEKEAPSSSRYLLCTCYFTDNSIVKVKEDVKTFMAKREKDNQYYHFINWQRQKNEIAVLTMYSYADILLPSKFDTIFQIAKPENCKYSEFEVTQAIINGWTTANQVSLGHKHILILEFPESIPDIFASLSCFCDEESSNNGFELGLCNRKDFESIKKSIKQQS